MRQACTCKCCRTIGTEGGLLTTQRLTVVVSDVGVDVVLDEYPDDVIAAQLAGVGAGRLTDVVPQVDVSSTAQQQRHGLVSRLLLLYTTHVFRYNDQVHAAVVGRHVIAGS